MNGKRPATEREGGARRCRPRPPTTLVEVLLACAVLAVLAVAAAAFFYQSLAALTTQRLRLLAREAANARLEALRAEPWAHLRPPVLSFRPFYLFPEADGWAHGETDPGETVSLGTAAYPLLSTVQYRDVDDGPVSCDCLELTVRVHYGPEASDVVWLQTRMAP